MTRVCKISVSMLYLCTNMGEIFMKKISAFYTFLAFVLVGASMAVVPAHAQATGSASKFCIYDRENGGGTKIGSVKLKQVESSYTPASSNEICYDTWAETYNWLSAWTSNTAHQYEGSYIEITSDLKFAGKNVDDESCKTGSDAFDGKMLDLNDKIALVGSSGSSRYKISGLCYIANVDEIGFVKGAKRVENLDFEKVFFKSVKTTSKVGIVANNSQSDEHVYQNIHVKNSSFTGYDVGAVLGNGAAYISNISLTDDTITSGNYGGGVVGYLLTNLKENDDGSINNVYSGFDVKSLRIRSLNGKTGGDTYFGGIAGFVMQYEKVVWAKSSLAGLDIQNASYAGGLLGMVNHSQSVSAAEETKYSEIDVGSKTNSIIIASKYAGGLVGYIVEDCAYTALSVTKNSVRASIRGGGSSGNSYVGGLIGFIHFTSIEKLGLTINYNKITNNVSDGSTDKVGYLVGSTDCKNVDFKSVQYNFYYGTSDETKIGIGSFNGDGNWLDGLMNGKHVNVSHNFRNAVSGLDADGVLVNETKPIKNTAASKSYYNGVIDADEMKSHDFVDVLNSGNSTILYWVYGDGGVYDVPSLDPNGYAAQTYYDVTFNLNSLSGGSEVVFGNAWAENDWKNTKKMKAIDSEDKFPKAYVLVTPRTGPKSFYMFDWGYSLSGDVFDDYLSTELLNKASGGNSTGGSIVLYPKRRTSDPFSLSPIDIYAIDDANKELKTSDDYHGKIVLSQTVGGTSFKQSSVLFSYNTSGDVTNYNHRLYVPETEDTLIFKVSEIPDPGYTMSIGFENTWSEAPASENWGYDVSKGELKYRPVKMKNSKFTVKYALLHYNVNFTIPQTVKGKDFFVANVTSTKMDWFANKENVTVKNIVAPTIFNSKGCLIGWKVAGEGVPEHNATVLSDELQYMVPANTNTDVNKLVPDVDNPQCDTYKGSYKITMNINGKGSFRLLQKIDDVVIAHDFTAKGDAFELEVPKAFYNGGATSVSFSMDPSPENGYKFDRVTSKKGSVTTTFVPGDKIVVNSDMELTVNFIPLYEPMFVTYNLDLAKTAADTSKTFVPTNAVVSEKITLKSDADSYKLWAPYRTDKCFGGWSLKTAAERIAADAVYNEIDASPNVYNAFSKDETEPTKLYAIWKDCAANPEPTISVKNGSSNATLVLYQKFGNAVLRHEVPSNGISLVGDAFDFYVDTERSVPKLGYVFTSSDYEVSYFDFPDQEIGTAVMPVNNAWRVEYDGFLQHSYSFIRPVELVRYDVVFNENNGGGESFFGDSWEKYLTTETFATDASGNWTIKQRYNVEREDRKFPKAIYRDGSCVLGYTFEKNDKTGGLFTEVDESFMQKYTALGTTAPVTMYAYWDDCDEGFTVYSVDGDKGSLTLTRTFELGDQKTVKRSYEVKAAGLKIPSNDEDISFTEILFKISADANYVEDKNATYVYRTHGSDGEWKEFSGLFTVKENTDIKAPLAKKKMDFTFTLDLSTDQTLFFGNDWAKDLDNVTVSSDASTTLPTMAYSAEQCLAGWSVTKDGAIYKEMNEKLVEEIYAAYPDLKETTKIKLYPRWTDNVDGCAGELVRVTADVAHGRIELVEKTGDKTTVHKFDDNGQMMLPSVLDGSDWTLRAIPDSSFVLDSLVVTQNDKVVAVLHEGDKLPKNMDNVVLTTFFGKKNKTEIEIVNTQSKKSGNTMQLEFSTSAFDAARKVSAFVKTVDVNTDKVVDSLFRENVKSASTDQVLVRVNKPGEYKVIIILTDGIVKVESFEDFTVESPFKPVENGSWQMVSFAAVDTKALNWDETHAYWWNEGGIGEFWQYNSVRPGDKLDASRGVWYSSQNEEPLVLRKDFVDDGKDIVWNLECANSGWNLVANPHGWAVNLYSNNERHSADEESDVKFWRYNSETGAYDDTVDVLGPYEAVWVQVSKKTKWEVSAEPVFDDLAHDWDKHPLLHKSAKSSTENKWTLQLALSDGKGKRDSRNLLGVSDRPFVADEPPAAMGDHVNLSIVDGKRALAKSIKAPSENMEWTVALSASSDRDGFFEIEGIESVNALGYQVYVTVDGKTTEMQEGSPLKVRLKSNSKTATVQVSKGAPVVAAKNALIKGLRSARLGNKLHVSFDASESLAGTNARVELLDVNGVVKASGSAKALYGTNALVLDAPQAGFYLLRVRAGSTQKISKILVK